MLPIHMAALNGHLDCVKKLLNNTEGFDIDTTDDAGRTCLHAAACGGYVDDALIHSLDNYLGKDHVFLFVVFNDRGRVPKLPIFIFYLLFRNPDVIDLLIATGSDFSLLDSEAK